MDQVNVFEPPVEAPPPSVSMRRILLGAAVGVLLGAGLAAHIFSLGWLQERDGWSATTPEFMPVVLGAAVIGFVAYYATFVVVRREKARVTPWVTAAVTLWFASGRLVQLGPHPNAIEYVDPRSMMAMYTLVAAGALIFVAILAFMDWRIRESERTNLNGATHE